MAPRKCGAKEAQMYHDDPSRGGWPSVLLQIGIFVALLLLFSDELPNFLGRFAQ
jgi:hypothetical protein